MAVDYVKRTNSEAGQHRAAEHRAPVVSAETRKQLRHWVDRYRALVREVAIANAAKRDPLVKNPPVAPYAARNAAADMVAHYGDLILSDLGK